METHHDYSVFADSGARATMKIAELQKSLKLVNEEMCHLRKAGKRRKVQRADGQVLMMSATNRSQAEDQDSEAKSDYKKTVQTNT